MIRPSSAISPGGLLAQHFEGASWGRWRAVLKASEGLKLTAAEQRLFQEVAERGPPKHPVSELDVVVGRGGGKDSVASAIATCAAVEDYSRYLRAGERAAVLVLAVDRGQAKICHGYIGAYFREHPDLAPLIVKDATETIELSNRVDIIIATNSFRSIRGRTVVCAVLDETAFWRDENFANPDEETYNALLPALARIPGSRLISISTPFKKSGLLYRQFSKYYGRNVDDILVVRGTSRQFNPTLSQSVIDRALERDPEAARAEWLAEWREDLADFISREVVEALVITGRRELPRISGQQYHAFTDASGGSSDSFTGGVTHREGGDGAVILDAVREIPAPFDPAKATAELAEFFKAYGCHNVTGDKYSAQWVVEEFGRHYINYIQSERSKSEIYLEALPMLNSGRVELLDNPRLVSQICSLQRKTVRGTGREVIDHPSIAGARDDLANSALGAIVLAGGHPDVIELWTRFVAGITHLNQHFAMQWRREGRI